MLAAGCPVTSTACSPAPSGWSTKTLGRKEVAGLCPSPAQGVTILALTRLMAYLHQTGEGRGMPFSSLILISPLVPHPSPLVPRPSPLAPRPSSSRIGRQEITEGVCANSCADAFRCDGP